MSKSERRELERKIEALIIAIPRELEAYEFYMQLADEYEDNASREMFKFLASQEQRHKESLQNILAKLEDRLANLPK